MSAAQKALQAISAVKIKEANLQFVAFEEFRQRTEPLGTSFDDVGQLLKECCEFWHGENIFVRKGNKTTVSPGDEASVDRSRVLANCQRMLERARLDDAAQYLVMQVREILVQEISRDQHELLHARLLSREIIDLSKDLGSPEAVYSTRTEQLEQLNHWRDLVVFTPDSVDEHKLESYLERVFTATTAGEIALDTLRNDLSEFSREIRSSLSFDCNSLSQSIRAIIATDILNEDQQSTLREYLKDKHILSELADVLQMRYNNLDRWQWQCEGAAIRAFQERKLNGKYRVYFDYELLDALLWHEIGNKWSAEIKRAMLEFYNGAWQRCGNNIFSQKDSERRAWFLGDKSAVIDPNSVAALVESLYKDEYFMSQLRADPNSRPEAYDGESDCFSETDKERDPEAVTSISYSERKQSLLRLVAADIQTYKFANEPVAVVTSDFKWFGPSISHKTILTTLKFFGVDDFWLKAFGEYLNMQFKFDGYPVEKRARGVPVSATTSDCLTESVLFVLDFAINHTGLNVFRMHDDLWLWGNPEKVRDAWQEIGKFTRATGLELNEEKTGSVTGSFAVPETGASSDPELPQGEVGCGFIRLNENLKFQVDEAKFKKHIEEMKTQIDSCKSLFRRVRAYNAYSKFLLANCFSPCRAFGVDHVEAVIRAFNQKIDPRSESLFDYLAQGSPHSQEWREAPKGVWYWPINMGGLGLYDPIVQLMQSREYLIDCAADSDRKLTLRSKSVYEDYKKRFNNRENKDRGIGTKPSREVVEQLSGEPFMSFEEFVQYRRYSVDKGIKRLFSDLSQVALGKSPTPVDTIELEQLIKGYVFDTSGPVRKHAHEMHDYWKYTVTTFGPSLAKQFGNLQLVKKHSAPLGLAQACASAKHRWTP